MASEQQKVTVTLPKGLLERLNETVPSRKRSLLISEAIAEQLDMIEQVSVLEETAGLWSSTKHPELKDDNSIDNWLKQSRQSWG